MTTACLASGVSFSPLTAMRKLVLLGIAAPALGLVGDFVFKANRLTEVVLGLVFGGASVWVFWTVLAQRTPAEALALGGAIALTVAWTVGFAASLREDAVRAGAAGLGLGLGSGLAAVWGASALLGLYGMGLGAASGAILLVQMITGRRMRAGLTYALTFGAIGALVPAAAVALAKLGWVPLAMLALVPLAARLPAPARWPIWAQSFLISTYTLGCAAVACFFAWLAIRGSAE